MCFSRPPASRVNVRSNRIGTAIVIFNVFFAATKAAAAAGGGDDHDHGRRLGGGGGGLDYGGVAAYFFRLAVGGPLLGLVAALAVLPSGAHGAIAEHEILQLPRASTKATASDPARASSCSQPSSASAAAAAAASISAGCGSPSAAATTSKSAGYSTAARTPPSSSSTLSSAVVSFEATMRSYLSRQKKTAHHYDRAKSFSAASTVRELPRRAIKI